MDKKASSEYLLSMINEEKNRWASRSNDEKAFRLLIYQLLENARVSAKKDAYYHNPEEYGSDYAYGVLLLTNEIVLHNQSEIVRGANLLPHPTFGDCEWCRSEREMRLSKLLLQIKQLNQDIENDNRIYIKLKCEEAEKDISFIRSCYTKAREAIEKVYDVYKCVKKTESEMIDSTLKMLANLDEFMRHFFYNDERSFSLADSLLKRQDKTITRQIIIER